MKIKVYLDGQLYEVVNTMSEVEAILDEMEYNFGRESIYAVESTCGFKVFATLNEYRD